MLWALARLQVLGMRWLLFVLKHCDERVSTHKIQFHSQALVIFSLVGLHTNFHAKIFTPKKNTPVASHTNTGENLFICIVSMQFAQNKALKKIQMILLRMIIL